VQRSRKLLRVVSDRRPVSFYVVVEDFEEEETGFSYARDEVWSAIELRRSVSVDDGEYELWLMRREPDGLEHDCFPGLHPFICSSGV
jgi:hypothetical protein